MNKIQDTLKIDFLFRSNNSDNGNELTKLFKEIYLFYFDQLLIQKDISDVNEFYLYNNYESLDKITNIKNIKFLVLKL